MERQQSFEARLLDLSNFQLGGTSDVDKCLSGDLFETASSAPEVPKKALSEISETDVPAEMAAGVLVFDFETAETESLPGQTFSLPPNDVFDAFKDCESVEVPMLAPDEMIVEDVDEPCAERAKVAEVAQVVTKSPRFRVRVGVEDGMRLEHSKLNVCFQLAYAALGSSKHEFNVTAVEKLKAETFEDGTKVLTTLLGKEVVRGPGKHVSQSLLREVSRRSETIEPLHELCQAGVYEQIWGNLSNHRDMKQEGSYYGLCVGKDKCRVFFFLDKQ